MSFLDEREQELGFRPQHENKYAAVFRSVPDFDATSVTYFKKIKKYLILSIANDDSSRTTAWMMNLTSYINLFGLKFDRSDHIELVQICYKLMCTPGIQTDLLHHTTTCLSALLRKMKTLSPEELNLDWKLLYDALKYYLTQIESSESKKNMIYMNHMRQAVAKVKNYFDETATQGLVELEIENLCPFSSNALEQSLFILSSMLPTEFMSGKELVAYRHWFDTLMTLWQSMTEKDIELEIMDIFSKFSFNNPGVIDWSPHLPFVYSRIIGFTGGTGATAKNNRDGNLNMMSCARWIVSTLGGRQNGQKYLDKFLTVFRTCKKGRNSSLENLIKNIIVFFWRRIWRESSDKHFWKSKVADDVKINDNDIDAFIDSIFSNFVQSTSLMHLIKERDVISKLVSLRPKVVIPKILASFDEAFADICFPNKYWMILDNLALIVHSCVISVKNGSFPEGVEILVPLLTKVLSYEPITNLATALTTFNVVSTFFSLVPVIDSSAFNINAEFSENESIVNANSSAYEEIALKALDIVFSQIHSLQHVQTRLDSESKTLDPMEQIQSSIVTTWFSKLLSNLSPQIFQSMIDKYKRFVFGEVKETNFAAVIIGKIGKAFAKTNPEATLKALVPDLVNEIVGCLDEEGNLVDARSESDLVYYLTILADVIDCDSPRIKQWVPLIGTIFPTTLLKCTLWDCVKMSASCLASCFSALSSASVEHESVVERYENSNVCPLEDWGLIRKFKELKFKIILPGPEEEELITDLLNRLIWPQVEYLEEFCNQDEKSRDQVKRALIILNSLLPLFDATPFWEEEALIKQLDDDEQRGSVGRLLNRIDVTFQGNRNIRKTVACVLIKTVDKIFQIDEHSVEALISLTHILGRILGIKIDFVCLFSWFKREGRDWTIGLLKNSDPTVRDHPLLFSTFKLKKLTGELSVIGREMITETHRAVIICLMKLAVSDYRSVQVAASNYVSCVENTPSFLGSNDIIYPQLKANLLLNPEMDSSNYKGTIEMLIQCCKDMSHPNVLQAGLLPLIFKPKGLDETVVGTVFSKFNDKIERISRGAQKLSLSLSNDDLPLPKELSDIYTEAVDSLLSLDFHSADGLVLPWNFEVTHLNLLKILNYPDQPLPSRAFKFVLSKVFSDLQPVHKVALRVSFFTLRSLKKNHTKNVLVKTSEVVKLNDSWEFGEDNLTDRIQFMTESPLTHDGNVLYIHKNHIGFTSWPKELSVSMEWELDEDYPGVIKSAFTPEMTKKLISIACTRSSPSFCRTNSRFYEYIFVICPGVVETFLDELTERFGTNPDETLLCTCVEILCGILKSMKHWPDDLRTKSWSKILDIFNRGIQWKVQNCLDHWGHCFNLGLAACDPRMVSKLFVLLTDWTFDDSSFAADLSKKMYFLSTAINNFSWRMANLNSLLLKKVSSYIDHESQMIRHEIAELLVVIFHSDVEFKGKRSSRSPRVKDFIQNLILPSVTHFITSPEDNDSETINKAKRTLTTVCRWLCCFFKDRYPVCPEMYELIPVLSVSSSKVGLEWEELKLISGEVLHVLAKQTLTSFDFQVVFPKLMSSLNCNEDFQLRGKARVEFLTFLQVFVFFSRPHIIFSDDCVNDLVTNILSGLKDESIDVRLTSKKLLADLIHFKLITDVDALINTFIIDVKKKAINSDPKTIITRQSAILGLLAFLTANPDDVPQYLSKVFKVLSRYSNDNHPVGQWIGKEVSDFMLLHENTRMKVEEVISRDILDEFGGANLPYFS